MRLYVIHSPRGADALDATDRAWAARTGFSLAALLFGPLWVAARALWLVLASYVLVAVIVFALVRGGWLWPGAALGVFALGQVYLGVEGRALAAAARARAGHPLVDLIYARSALEAEKAHLERTLTAAPTPVRRGASRGAQEIIGLFPEAGR